MELTKADWAKADAIRASWRSMWIATSWAR